MSKLFNVKIPEITVLEDGSVVVAARLTDGTPAKTFLKQVDISTISYTITVKKTGQITLPPGIAVADVLFDEPKPWDCDARGYNFLFTLPPDSFPDGSVKYAVEFKVKLTGGHVGWIKFDVKTKNVFTS